MLTADKDVAQQKLRFIAAENGKLYSILEDSLAAFYKIKYVPTIQFNKHSHGYLSKSFGNLCFTKTCMWMLIAAFFMTVKNWKQPRCPSLGECIKQLWFTCTRYIHVILLKGKKIWPIKPWKDIGKS